MQGQGQGPRPQGPGQGQGLHFFTMYKDLQQGWVSAGRNPFLPDMRFKPV